MKMEKAISRWSTNPAAVIRFSRVLEAAKTRKSLTNFIVMPASESAARFYNTADDLQEKFNISLDDLQVKTLEIRKKLQHVLDQNPLIINDH